MARKASHQKAEIISMSLTHYLNMSLEKKQEKQETNCLI